MIKNIDEAKDILYDLAGRIKDEEYSNGMTNVFIFYYDEIEGGARFHNVKFLKQTIKNDIIYTEKENAKGKATSKELDDLKTMFKLLFS